MNVTSRIKQIKQPWGGYIRPKYLTKIQYDDGIALAKEENVRSSIIGLVVDCMTRFMLTNDVSSSFKVSIAGARAANSHGALDSLEVVERLSSGIKGLDSESLINACKIVNFDVWIENPAIAMYCPGYEEINPDKNTINNLKVLIKRSLKFLEQRGPVKKIDLTFRPVDNTLQVCENGHYIYGGYTDLVSTGNGDYLTEDTLWDIKVSSRGPNSKNTLQILMYWIMGQHSGQECFKGIDKIGIFNPRLNTEYTYKISAVPQETIKIIEDEVIGY